jgi:hypothetical protein
MQRFHGPASAFPYNLFIFFRKASSRAVSGAKEDDGMRAAGLCCRPL